MHFAPIVAALAGVATAAPSGLNFWHKARDTSSGTSVAPGSVKDMLVTKETTLNGTWTGKTTTVPPNNKGNDLPLPITMVNNFAGSINAYLSGTCPNGASCFVRGDGSLVYPSAGGSATPVSIDSNTINIPLTEKQTFTFNLPGSLISARIWFAAGDLSFGVVATATGNGMVQPAANNPSDPSANINWGFVEFNVGTDGTIYANISYVDFVGLVLGMQLEDNNGPTQTARGLAPGSADAVCSDLRAQASTDGYPWDKMCMTGSDGSVVRVLSPNDYTAIDSNGFANYWSSYVDSVYTQYASQPLYTETQFGELQCTASGDTITCANDEISYPKPSAIDIWGCNSGPFANTGSDTHKANLAILCAAFHRSTLLLNGGNKQPSLSSDNYYTVEPSNFFSKAVHKNELDGKGYAFPYDDVNPGSENASGTVSSGNPKALTIWIGGN